MLGLKLNHGCKKGPQVETAIIHTLSDNFIL